MQRLSVIRSRSARLVRSLKLRIRGRFQAVPLAVPRHVHGSCTRLCSDAAKQSALGIELGGKADDMRQAAAEALAPFRDAPPSALAIMLPLTVRTPTPARLATKSVLSFPEATAAMGSILSGQPHRAVEPLEGVVRALDAAIGPSSAPAVAARQFLATAQYQSNKSKEGARTLREILGGLLGEDPDDGSLLLPGLEAPDLSSVKRPAAHPEDIFSALQAATVYSLMHDQGDSAAAWADELLIAIHAWAPGEDNLYDGQGQGQGQVRWMDPAESAALAGVPVPEVNPNAGLSTEEVLAAWRVHAHSLALLAIGLRVAEGVPLPGAVHDAASGDPGQSAVGVELDDPRAHHARGSSAVLTLQVAEVREGLHRHSRAAGALLDLAISEVAASLESRGSSIEEVWGAAEAEAEAEEEAGAGAGTEGESEGPQTPPALSSLGLRASALS